MRERLTQSRAIKLRRELTDSERHLWKFLRRRYMSDCRFRRQVPIGPYIADFACLDPAVIIEIDGGQHAAQTDYDAARSAYLNQRGFKVMRFWSNEVLNQTDAVLEAIWRVLEDVKTPPS